MTTDFVSAHGGEGSQHHICKAPSDAFRVNHRRMSDHLLYITSERSWMEKECDQSRQAWVSYHRPCFLASTSLFPHTPSVTKSAFQNDADDMVAWIRIQ